MTELQKLLDDFNALKIKDRNGLTFLEIARFPNIENVWSNMLAFYINPNNEHNLFDLILKSLFETANIKASIINFKNIRVRTEYVTDLGNRIDIVIFADNFILGIENKVDAMLHNNLNDYSNTIEGLAIPQDLTIYKIVLSKNRTSTTNGFINIIYTDLVKNIKKNIGDFTGYSDTKYLIFLFDFLNNIEKNINSLSMIDNPEVINFFHDNIHKVNKLLEYHKKISLDLIQKMNAIHSFINKEEIKTILKTIPKSTQFGGQGRFIWRGIELIKYEIKVQDIVFFYQIGIGDYKLVSSYWFKGDKYHYLTRMLEINGVNKTIFEYDQTPEEISMEVKRQIINAIEIFNDATN